MPLMHRWKKPREPELRTICFPEAGVFGERSLHGYRSQFSGELEGSTQDPGAQITATAQFCGMV